MRALGVALAGLGALVLSAPPSGGTPTTATSLDLASWAAELPERFHVSGQKTEPTYQLQTDIARNGDLFAVLGGAPSDAARALVRVHVSAGATGEIRTLPCPASALCGTARGAPGHLATAALVAAARAGQLEGWVEVLPYGRLFVVCLPGEMLGVNAPILDPCFETSTGAAIAQRHRNSGAFEGPSLDPHSVWVHADLAQLPSDLLLNP